MVTPQFPEQSRTETELRSRSRLEQFKMMPRKESPDALCALLERLTEMQASSLSAFPALVTGRQQTLVRNAGGTFQLFRIGDAVENRNIHAAIYDGLRLCKDL